MQLKAWIDSQARFRSITDVAKELGVSPQHLHYILKGERNPSVTLVQRIVELTDGAVTPSDLITSADRGTPDPDVQTGPMPAPISRPALVIEDRDPVRLCVDLPRGLVEELRNVVWWSGGDMTLTAVVQEAIEARLQTYRNLSVQLAHPHTGAPVPKRAGQPYPTREGVVRRGRPLV
jgi:hypothetical protein